MSKAVLISIKPEWVDLIMAGEKKTEIRKTAPLLPIGSMPFNMYIYQCGTGKIVGICECHKIRAYNINKDEVKLLSDSSCVPPKRIYEYAGAKEFLYGWELKKARWFKEPKPLSAFGMKHPPQSWCYVEDGE